VLEVGVVVGVEVEEDVVVAVGMLHQA
jgi:hypothetical protein